VRLLSEPDRQRAPPIWASEETIDDGVREMRILYFYQYFTTPAGAWSTRVYEFAQRCVEQGDSVTVVTSIYDKSDLRSDKLLSRCNIDGIDVRIINVTLSNRHGFVQRMMTFFV